MPPEARKLLADMLNAAEAVQHFVAGKTLDNLRIDDVLRSSVYFKFVIMGEALAKLRRSFPTVADQITESRRIVAFRNQIIHGYGLIDDEITWRIIEAKVPVLVQELVALLASASADF